LEIALAIAIVSHGQLVFFFLLLDGKISSHVKEKIVVWPHGTTITIG